tara:strand:- start:25 stop:201 length:177 start_codon:yes stop_codon:yes gene_type:complete
MHLFVFSNDSLNNSDFRFETLFQSLFMKKMKKSFLMDQHESLGTGFNEMIDVPKNDLF